MFLKLGRSFLQEIINKTQVYNDNMKKTKLKFLKAISWYSDDIFEEDEEAMDMIGNQI